MQTDALYGEAPRDLGEVDIMSSEMMFWLYCPIKFPSHHNVVMPDNLRQFMPIVDAVEADVGGRWDESYIYLTAKTLFVSGNDCVNRPGWHSDGFLTEDLNYIWCDAVPTVFWEPECRVSFSANHIESLKEMEERAEPDTRNHRRYPLKHLLRLDQSVIHKVGINTSSIVRTFIKVSVSNHRYALRGNSINHALAVNWTYQDRKPERNCPISNGRG